MRDARPGREDTFEGEGKRADRAQQRLRGYALPDAATLGRFLLRFNIGHWVIVANDTERTADELERWQREKANVENRIKEAKLGLGLDNLPSQISNANSAYLLLTLIAYNLLVWLKPLFEQFAEALTRIRALAAA